MDFGYFGNVFYKISGINIRYVCEILSVLVNGFNILLGFFFFENLCFM